MSYRSTISIHVFLLIVCTFGFGVAIFLRVQAIKNSDSFAADKNENENNRRLSALYGKFTKFPFFKRYLENIRNKYQIFSPDNFEIIQAKSMKLAFANWFFSLLIIVVSILLSRTFFMAITTSIALVIFNSYRLYISIAKENLKLLKSFNIYLGEVRQSFITYRTVEDALFHSLTYTKEPLSQHIQKIYDALTSDDVESASSTYRSIAPSKYLKLFLSLCLLVQTYGDKGKDNDSQFEKNILALKEDVCEEIDNRDKLLYRLSGYVPLAVLPMCLLQPIKMWGISILSSLESFFNGYTGIFLAFSIILVTIISYNVLVEIKQIRIKKVKEHPILLKICKVPFVDKILNSYEYTYYSKTLKINEALRLTGDSLSVRQFLVKRVIYSITIFFACGCLSFYAHHSTKNSIIHNVDDFVSDTGSVDEEQKRIIKEAIQDITLKYSNDYSVTKEQIVDDLISRYTIFNYQVMYATSDEIVARIHKYQNEYFHWYELVIILLFSVITYFVPLFYLNYKKHLIQMDMEDEIVQFQSIIIMMKDIKRIGVIDILECMEEYAVIFKKSISTCIDNYSSGDVEALEVLKETEKFPMFQHLIDSLILCDKIRIDLAFNDLWDERENNQRKRRFDNEKLLLKKELNSKIVAWIPFILVLALYLIIPFVTESIYGYMENQDLINSSYNDK